MRRQMVGPLNDTDFAVKLPGKNGRIQAEKLDVATSCRCDASLRIDVNQYCQSTARTYSAGRFGEGIAAEEREHVGVVGEQTLFGERHKVVLLPVAERGEPEIPVEAGLIGRVDSGRLVERLRLVAEGIGVQFWPSFGALEFDLIAAARHHGEEAVLVGDAKWFQRRDGR